MTYLDLSNKNFRVVITKPDEVNGLDVSALVESCAGSYSYSSEGGLAPWTGTLQLAAYPLQPFSESLNPRTNPDRFQRGNKVEIWLANASDTLVLVKTVYLLKWPAPPYPRKKTSLDLELGCKLALHDRPAPPSDGSESGISLGTSRSAQQVLQSYLSKAGAGTLQGSISGSLIIPPQKLSNGSYLSVAGQIAFAKKSYLRCQADGDVIVCDLELEPTEIATLEIGTNEADYEAILGSETPVHHVVCTSTKQDAVATPDGYTQTNTDYAPARLFDWRGGDQMVVSRKEVIRDEWAGSVRTVTTTIYEPKALVFPWELDNRTDLTESQTRIRTSEYEAGEEGRLRSESEEIYGPLYNALPAYYAGQGQNDIAGSKQTALIQRTTTTYEYDSEDAARRISTVRSELAGAILPNIFWGENYLPYTPFTLVTTGGELQTWTGTYSGEFRANQITYDSFARSYPEVIESLPQDSPIEAMLGTFTKSSKSRTSNTGGTQPPQADRRKPTHTIEEEAIEGEAFFAPIGGDATDEPRIYDVPFMQSQSDLNWAAQYLGSRVNGQQLSCSWSGQVTDFWLSDPDPLGRITITETDGSVVAYAIENLGFSFDSKTRLVGGDGLYLGTVSAASGNIRKPYTQPIQGGVEQLWLGAITAAFAPTEVSGGVEQIWLGQVVRMLQPIQGGVEQLWLGEIRAPLTGTVEQSWTGEIQLVQDNIVQGSLTGYFDPTQGLTVIDNGGGLDYDVDWNSQEVSGTFGSAFFYYDLQAPNAFGTGIKGLRLGDSAFDQYTILEAQTPKDQSDDYLGTNAYTVFVVFKANAINTSVSSRGYNFGDSDDIIGDGFEFGLYLRDVNGTDEIVLWNNDGTDDEVYLSISLNTTYIVTAWHDAGQINLQLNNGTPTSTASGDRSSPNILTLGAVSGFSLDGWIGHVLLYNGSLAAGTRAAILADLNAIYGVY